MRKILMFLLFSISLVALSGCGKQETIKTTTAPSTAPTSTALTNADIPETMTLRLGAANDFKAIRESCSLIGDPLVGMDENYNPTPWLIRNWDSNEDATTYTLHLQEGVNFSDGTPFNAEVCQYDIEVLGRAYYCNYINTLESLDIIDNYTLKATFSTTNLNFLTELIKIPGMQIDSLDENGNLTTYVGTGPFVLTDYAKDVEATLIRNENYWNQERFPHVTEVKWIVVPSAEARAMALESGQVDIIGFTENESSVPNSSIQNFKSNPHFKVMNNDIAYDAVFSIGMNWKEGPLKDVNLRKAIGYAIDREILVETVYFGVPVVSGHMMNPAFPDGSNKVEAFTYDLEKARNILLANGYTLENNILTKAGTPITLEYVTTTATEDTDLAVFTQAALKEIGIDVKITTLGFALAEERMKTGEYDLTLGVYWFAPTVSALAYYGIEDAYNSMGAYGGLGFGVTNELTQLAQALFSAKSQDELSMAADVFWAANYEACPTIPFSGRVRTAIYQNDWSGFVFNSNYYVIDLTTVTKSR